MPVVPESLDRSSRRFRCFRSPALSALLAVAAIVAWPLAISPAVFADEITAVEQAQKIDLKKLFAGAEPASLDELRAMQDHQRNLVGKLVDVTVGIIVGSAHGSGVVISDEGYILTAAHVAGRPNRRATIIFADGERATGKTLGIYRTLDAGLVKLDGDGPWPFAEMAQLSAINDGQWCVCTGHPGGYQEDRTPVVRIGRVLYNDRFAITTDCTLIGGDSGGPLFDMDGRVIGINSRIGRFLTANMHVPIAAFHTNWERLVKADAWGSFPGMGPYIGVQGDTDSDQAKIVRVSPGAPAEKAGIKPGDVIVRFGGREVSDFASLQLYVNDYEPGDEVPLVVQRGDDRVELKIKVGKRD